MAFRRLLPLLLALTAVLLATLYARMLIGARTELLRAANAAAHGDRTKESTHLQRALAYYAPANPWHRRAAALLRQRAREAEAAGHPNQALALWRTLRGGILGLRGLTQPLSAYLPEADKRIAALSARQARAATHLRGPAGQKALLSRLRRPEEPRRGWTATALAGFVLFLVAALLTIFFGLDAQTHLRPKRFWPLLLLTLLSLGLLFGGLANAAIREQNASPIRKESPAGAPLPSGD